MPRTPPEWIGRTDDTPVPSRVRLRVFDRYQHACDKCQRTLCSGERWACDHIVPLILGGENRERNLHPLCGWCHPEKTAAEIAQKAADYMRRRKHAGIKTRAGRRPLPGTIASGWRHRMNGGWERR